MSQNSQTYFSSGVLLQSGIGGGNGGSANIKSAYLSGMITPLYYGGTTNVNETVESLRKENQSLKDEIKQLREILES